MAKHKLTVTYPLQYRFQCEHCEQTTNWKNAFFKTEFDTDEDDKEEQKKIEAKVRDSFLKGIPEMQEKVNNGDYEDVYVRSGKNNYDNLNSLCPRCKKYQSWHITNIEKILIVLALCVGIALLGWFIFQSGAEAVNGKRQLLGVALGLLGAVGVLFSLIEGIQEIRIKMKISRDTKNVKEIRKPEFSWQTTEKV